ncbi:cerebral dopamine neurotrophic factor [Struthio camelus]|uniref:cerebral dopamine neurotrophic factor n=1 Tax=Struthio camelus TaxID=8801 RepID=UPI003603AF2E
MLGARISSRIYDGHACKEFLDRFYSSLKRDSDFAVDTIEKELVSSCEDAKGKGQHLEPFSFVNALLRLVTLFCGTSLRKPLDMFTAVGTANHKDTKRKLDLKSVELSKMREAELWKLLSSWGEVNRACMEKTELGSLMKVLVPKHACGNLRSDTVQSSTY